MILPYKSIVNVDNVKISSIEYDVDHERNPITLSVIRDALSCSGQSLPPALIVPFSISYSVAWLGALSLFVILLLQPLWWTCLFGLPTFLVLIGGIITCAIPTIQRLF